MTISNYFSRHKKTGYTLVELMLYIALAAVILSAIVAFLNITMMNKVKNQAIIEVEQQGYQAIRTLTYAIRNASDTITTPTRGNSSSSLVINTSPNPTTYSVSANKLQVAQGAQIDDLTSGNVQLSGLNFQNISKIDSRDVIKISFTLSYNNPTTRNERDYSQTFYGSASKRK